MSPTVVETPVADDEAVPERLREARPEHRAAEREPAAEEEQRSPVDLRRLAPRERAAALASPARQDEEERRAEDGDRPLGERAGERRRHGMAGAEDERQDARGDPERDGEEERGGDAPLSGGHRARGRGGGPPAGLAGPAARTPERHAQDQGRDADHRQHHGKGDEEPRHESDVDSRQGRELPDGDEVRGRADGRPDASDRGAVGAGEEERPREGRSTGPLPVERPERRRGRWDRASPSWRSWRATSRGPRRAPANVQTTRRGEALAAGIDRIAHARRRSRPCALIASRQEERAQEEEDDRVAERRERLPRRDDAEDDGEGRPEDGGHRERDGLGDPPDEDPGDDREEPRGPGPEARRREGEEQGERDRAEDEPGSPAAPLEALLRLGEATLRGRDAGGRT